MLDTRRLRVFREVAQHGSFSAAAEALGYTQPAVSRQIATLEAELGAVLVRRVPQGAVLTDAGLLLLDRADAILARLDDTEAELRALAGLEQGRLRLATFASAAASIVPAAVARFRARHPGVELNIVMADPIDSLPGLRAGELDLALSHDPLNDATVTGVRSAVGGDGATQEVLGIELIHLFDDPMYVAMPAGHPLVDAPALDLGCFAEEPWMLATHARRARTRGCSSGPATRRGSSPRSRSRMTTTRRSSASSLRESGVALIPDMVTRADPRGRRRSAVLDPAPPPRPIMVAMPAGYRVAGGRGDALRPAGGRAGVGRAERRARAWRRAHSKVSLKPRKLWTDNPTFDVGSSPPWRPQSHRRRRPLTTRRRRRPTRSRHSCDRICARPTVTMSRSATQPRRLARRVLHRARALGLRQDDDAATDRRVRAAGLRRARARRRGRDRMAAVPARRQHGLSGLRAVPAHVRGRERRVRAQGQARAGVASGRSGPSRHSRWCGWRASASADRSSSPAASASASRSRGRSSTSRASCSSTSRSARSTSSCARRCSSSSSAFSVTSPSRSRSSTSRTTRTRH